MFFVELIPVTANRYQNKKIDEYIIIFLFNYFYKDSDQKIN